MALELEDTELALLTLYVDASGGLALRHGAIELSAHSDHVLVRSNAEAVTFVISAPAGMSLGASYEDDDGEQAAWPQTSAGVHYKFEDPTTDPLEITLTATSDDAATSDPPKKKKVRVEAKPGGALPDKQD